MAKSKEKEIAVTEDSNMMIFGDSAGELGNYQADAGLGNEQVTADDMATPRIVLLQGLSKIVQDGFVGARPGLFHNSVTDEIFEEKYIIPLDYRKEYAVFKKRDLGGGFEGSFLSEPEAGAFVETLDGDAGNYDIIESARHALLTLTDKGAPDQPALMHFSSTALGSSDAWNSALHMTLPDNAPRFAGVWKLSPEKRSKSGNTWFVPSFTFMGMCPAALYEEARKWYFSISGKAQQQEEKQAS